MKLLLLLMSAALVLVTQAKEKPKPAGKAASSSFLQLEDEFMKESLALSPVSASQAGYHRHKGRELDPELDDELRLEARVLDLIHHLNSMRRDAGLELTDRIVVTLPANDQDLLQHRDWIADEVLASLRPKMRPIAN